MPFFLVDDGFHGHPKIGGIPAGAQRERAAGLWSLAGSWSAKYLTEGRIPHAQVTSLGGTHATARLLVDAGLWKVTDDGYAFLRDMPSLWDLDRQERRKPIPGALRFAVYSRDGFACVFCSSTVDLTLDHIRPWSHGGPDTLNNLQTLCRPCNSSKGNRV